MEKPEPLAYLKEWVADDGSQRRRVDLTDYLDPWMLKYNPKVTPLYAASQSDGGATGGFVQEEKRMVGELDPEAFLGSPASGGAEHGQ